MSNFDIAVNYVIGEELGFVNNGFDKGGPTKYGISQRLLKSLSSDTLRACGIFGDPNLIETIQELEVDQAKAIYHVIFWSDKFEQIHNQEVCNYLFDMAVNMGVAQAVKLIQRASWALSCNMKLVLDDGVFGKITLNEINTWNGLILPPLRVERANFYHGLEAHNVNDKEFINGWIKRSYK